MISKKQQQLQLQLNKVFLLIPLFFSTKAIRQSRLSTKKEKRCSRTKANATKDLFTKHFGCIIAFLLSLQSCVVFLLCFYSVFFRHMGFRYRRWTDRRKPASRQNNKATITTTTKTQHQLKAIGRIQIWLHNIKY